MTRLDTTPAGQDLHPLVASEQNRPVAQTSKTLPVTVRRDWLLMLAGFTVLCSAIALAWELTALPGPLQYQHNDFLAFYSGAYFVLNGAASLLYEQNAVSGLQHLLLNRYVDAAGYMPYLNPPFVALLLSPLAFLSYTDARQLWLGVNLALVGWALLDLTRTMQGRTRTVALLLLAGSAPIYWTLAQGQLSLLLLFGCLKALSCARDGRPRAAGLWLCVVWFKPHLAVLTLLGLVLMGRRREAASMTLAGTGLVLASLWVLASSVYVDYATYAWDVFVAHASAAQQSTSAAWTGSLEHFLGLNGLTSTYLPGATALVVSATAAVIGLVLVTLWWFATRPMRPGLGALEQETMLAATVGLGLLLDPHLFMQDIVLAFVAVPLVFAHARQPLAGVGALIVACLTLLLDRVVTLHLFTWAMLLLTLAVLVRALLWHGRVAQPQAIGAPG